MPLGPTGSNTAIPASDRGHLNRNRRSVLANGGGSEGGVSFNKRDQVMEKEDNLKRLLKVAEVAEMLNVSARTVWRMVSSGELPRPVNVGRCVRWRICDIDSYIQNLKS